MGGARATLAVGLLIGWLGAACSGGGGGGGGGGTPAPAPQPSAVPADKGEVSGTLRPFRGATAPPSAQGSSARGMPDGLAAAARRALATRPDLAASPKAARAPVAPAPAGELVPREFIVKLEQPLDAATVSARLAQPGYRAVVRAWASDRLVLVRLEPDGARAERDTAREPPGDFARRMVPLLERAPGVRRAEPNPIVRGLAVPNDRLYRLQWHYPAMNLPGAWEVTTGSASTVVAVVDTGIVPHPDLDAKVLPGYDFITDPESAGDGDGRDANPRDMGGELPNGGSNWHGTHVAGTVGAVTDNRTGVAGVDWRARVLPVRVLGRPNMTGTGFDIVSGMRWAAGGSVPGAPLNRNPAQVVNLSLGSKQGPVQVYQDVIDEFPNTLFVVGAGNNAEDASQFHPCNQRGVVCVGAVGLTGKRASYSNFGGPVDLVAPGGENADANGDGRPDGVVSTSRTAQGRPGYSLMLGTSMATPHVAGVAALMVAARAQAGGPPLSAAELERFLVAASSPTRGCDGCGAGLLNARNAVLLAAGRAPSGPPRLSVSTAELFFQGAETLDLLVTNLGGDVGGPLQVAAAGGGVQGTRVSFPQGAALEVPAGQTRPLAVAVDPAGLADGDHEATVELDGGAAGRATVALRIRVGGGPVRDAVIGFAYQDAAGSWQVDDEGLARVPASGGYVYRLLLTPRRYWALASIDDDGDGQYFEEGERTGFWRSIDQFEPIDVAGGQRVTDISFDLVPLRAGVGGGSRVGDACTDNTDCGERGLCLALPGGYCSLACNSSADCPEDARCYLINQAGTRRCLQTCTDVGQQGTCRTGYVCKDDGTGAGICRPG